MANLPSARRVENMKMLLSILRSLTGIKLTMRLAEPLILAFSPRGQYLFSAKGVMSYQLAVASPRHKNPLALKARFTCTHSARSTAKALLDSRFQRWLRQKLLLLPGALPQACIEPAPLALNKYPVRDPNTQG
jgi:hypothetical protein